MVVVFALSITPTIVFHNWLANHTDTVKRSVETTGDYIGKQTFNCHCDNIVAESPFTETAKTIITYPLQPHSSVNAELQVQYFSSQRFHYSLRGPPAA